MEILLREMFNYLQDVGMQENEWVPFITGLYMKFKGSPTLWSGIIAFFTSCVTYKRIFFNVIITLNLGGGTSNFSKECCSGAIHPLLLYKLAQVLLVCQSVQT